MTDPTSDGKPAGPITPTGRELPSGAAAAFDALGTARRLLREGRTATLATLDPGGHPLATLVTVATDPEGAPLLFLSELSLHTRNLARDGRASLLIARGGKGDPLAHPRLTLVGTAARDQDPAARRRFLARHPKAALYAELPDFAMWRFAVGAAHLNGGFARAAEIAAGDLLVDVAGADGLLEAEPSALAHLNEDHVPALARIAAAAGAPPGPWRAVGLDPEGLDLVAGDRALRVPFPVRVEGAGALATTLKAMAAEARRETPA